MKTVRVVQNITLSEGDGPTKGLFNLACCMTDETSDWFNEEVKNKLMDMDDNEFLDFSTELIEVSNNKKI